MSRQDINAWKEVHTMAINYFEAFLWGYLVRGASCPNFSDVLPTMYLKYKSQLEKEY